jgi:hypothetical protein
VHIFGAILCVLIAGVLASVVVNDWSSNPGEVTLLAAIAAAIMLVSAARIYLTGARRRQRAAGPRTKIVLAVDESAVPRRQRRNRRAPSGD